MAAATMTSSMQRLPHQNGLHGDLPTRSSSRSSSSSTSSSTRSGRRQRRDGPSSAESTLKTLYPSAARAFVHRDIGLTQTLVDSAFGILGAHPPTDSSIADPLAALRKKWELLRITVEATAYTSPTLVTASSTSGTTSTSLSSSSTSSSSSSSTALPFNLRTALSMAPRELVQTMYDRSLKQFTPLDDSTRPSPVYLPSQIVSALAFAALKLDCPAEGRAVVEGWFDHRGETTVPTAEGGFTLSPLADMSPEGYEKLVEIYCVQILPRLGEWDVAMRFLKSQDEMVTEKKKLIYTSLKTLHTQVMNPTPPPQQLTRRSADSSKAAHSSESSSHGANGPSINILNGDDDRAVSPGSSGGSSVATAMPKMTSTLNDSSIATPSSSLRPIQSNIRSTYSSSSISSVSSQQTVRPLGPGGHPSVGGRGGTGSLVGASRLRASPSPRRGSGSPRTGVHDLAASTTSSRSVGGRSASSSGGRGSHLSKSNTNTFPRPPRAPSPSDVDRMIEQANDTSRSQQTAAASASQRSVSRPSVGEALRTWYVSYMDRIGLRHLTETEFGRMAPVVLAAIAILGPLIGFVVRLRAAASSNSSAMAGAGRSLGPRKLIGGGRGGSVSGSSTNAPAGMVRWLWDAVRDGVVMAGKGLV